MYCIRTVPLRRFEARIGVRGSRLVWSKQGWGGLGEGRGSCV